MKTFYPILRALEPSANINILMYHGFTDQTTFSGIENYHGKHLHIDKFKEQVGYLKAHYNIIALEDLINCLANQVPIPPRAVVLTIDDGYKSNFTLAYPVLKKFAAPAAIFVATDFIAKKSFLWTDRLEHALNTTAKGRVEFTLNNITYSYTLKDLASKINTDLEIKTKLKKLPAPDRDFILEHIEHQLQQRLRHDQPMPAMYAPLEEAEIKIMADEQVVSIGSHTATHVIVTACAEGELKAELLDSKRAVEEWTQRPCTLFSYPNGGIGDFNDGSQQMLKDFGFCCALTTMVGTNTPHSDVFKLKRLNLHNAGGFSGFIITLSSLGRFLRKIKNANLRQEHY